MHLDVGLFSLQVGYYRGAWCPLQKRFALLKSRPKPRRGYAMGASEASTFNLVAARPEAGWQSKRVRFFR